MSRWLEEAKSATQEGDFKKALYALRFGLANWDQDSAVFREAEQLAAELSAKTDGRTQKRAKRYTEEFAAHVSRREEVEQRDEHGRRLVRIESNVTLFVLMKMDDEGDPNERINAEAFAPIGNRISAWRSALDGCFSAGYVPVERFGRVPMSEVEQVRLQGLMRETANTIALEHSHVVDNVRHLRAGVPACLGYAATGDDVRFRELLSVLERHSGRSFELPSELAMSTSLLDAMEAAAPPADERDLFKLVAGAAFYVGVGAGVEDVIEASTGSPADNG